MSHTAAQIAELVEGEVIGDANIVYQGALDNAPRGEGEGEYVNYIEAALTNIKNGEPVATAETKSYGCSVKY